MTSEERLEEFRSWGPVLEIDFDKFHERMEELVGRPVWTHEFARPELLEHEIATGQRLSIEGVMAKLPADKPTIILDASKAGESRSAVTNSTPGQDAGKAPSPSSASDPGNSRYSA